VLLGEGEGGGGDAEGLLEDEEELEGEELPREPEGLAAFTMGVKPAITGVGGPGGVVQLPACKSMCADLSC